MRRPFSRLVIFFGLFVFFIFCGATEISQLFLQAIEKTRKLLPPEFSCQMKSDLFDLWFEQLPDEAFDDRQKKPPVVIFSFEKGGSIVYSVENIKESYVEFFMSYFEFIRQTYDFLLFSETDILEMFKDYTFESSSEEDLDVFSIYLPDNSQAYGFGFSKDSLLKFVRVFSYDEIQIEMIFEFEKILSYSVPVKISVSLYETDESFDIHFSNYKILKKTR